MSYNATAYKLDATGEVVSVQAVELNEDGVVVRAAGHWTHNVGTPAFEAEWRSGFFSAVADVRIVRDGGRGYRERLARLALPASYFGDEA